MAVAESVPLAAGRSGFRPGSGSGSGTGFRLTRAGRALRFRRCKIGAMTLASLSFAVRNRLDISPVGARAD